MPPIGHRERTGISLTKTGITIYSLTERGSSDPALQAYSKFRESSLLNKALVQPFGSEGMRKGQTEGFHVPAFDIYASGTTFLGQSHEAIKVLGDFLFSRATTFKP